jgi:hypothetical protein
MFDIPKLSKLKPFKSRYHLPANPTRREETEYINNRKIEAYQNLVVALSAESKAIDSYGAFSLEVVEAEQETASSRRRYEIWRKK